MVKQPSLEQILEKMGACATSVAWARNFRSPKKAWKECQDPMWLIWVIEQCNWETRRQDCLLASADILELGNKRADDEWAKSLIEASIDLIRALACNPRLRALNAFKEAYTSLRIATGIAHPYNRTIFHPQRDLAVAATYAFEWDPYMALYYTAQLVWYSHPHPKSICDCIRTNISFDVTEKLLKKYNRILP